MENFNQLILILLFIFFPVLSLGIIRKVRARAQGRKGPPLFQNLYDFSRLIQKKPIDGLNSSIYAEIAPLIVFIAGLVVWSIVVYEWSSFLLIPFFLAIQRVATIGFAMETGTSFGGLGTSREILLSVSSEPILLFSILAAQTKLEIGFSIIGFMLGILFLGALFIAILAELARPPFDDPRTHLELTMVHEAMLLEASGRTLVFFDLGYQLKMATLFVLLIRIGLEHSKFANTILPKYFENLITVAGALSIAFLIGYWESISVRRKWSWVAEILGMTFLILIVLGSLVNLK